MLEFTLIKGLQNNQKVNFYLNISKFPYSIVSIQYY